MDNGAWANATIALSTPFILMENPEVVRNRCFLSKTLLTFLICNGNYESLEEASSPVGLKLPVPGYRFMPAWFLHKCVAPTAAEDSSAPPAKKGKQRQPSETRSGNGEPSSQKNDGKGKAKDASSQGDGEQCSEEMSLTNRKALQVRLGRFVDGDKDGHEFARMFPMGKSAAMGMFLLPSFFKASGTWEGWNEKSTNGSASAYFQDGGEQRSTLESILKAKPGPWDGPNKNKNIEAFFASLQKGCSGGRKLKGSPKAGPQRKTRARKAASEEDDDDSEDDPEGEFPLHPEDEDEEHLDYDGLLRVLKSLLVAHNHSSKAALQASLSKIEALVKDSGTSAGTSSGSDALSNAEREELNALRARKHEWEHFQQEKNAWEAEKSRLKDAQRFGAMTIGTALKNESNQELTTMMQLAIKMCLPEEVAEVFTTEIERVQALPKGTGR